jgi:hypothetical protein
VRELKSQSKSATVSSLGAGRSGSESRGAETRTKQGHLRDVVLLWVNLSAITIE